MKKTYTPEEIEDIKKRQQEVIDFLKEKQVNPIAYLSYHNLGDDTFSTKVDIILQDTKFTEKTKEEKVNDILEAEVKPVEEK